MSVFGLSLWTHMAAYFAGVLTFPVLGYGVLKLMEYRQQLARERYEPSPKQDYP